MLSKKINNDTLIQYIYAYVLDGETKPVTFTFTDKLFNMTKLKRKIVAFKNPKKFFGRVF